MPTSKIQAGDIAMHYELSGPARCAGRMPPPLLCLKHGAIGRNTCQRSKASVSCASMPARHGRDRCAGSGPYTLDMMAADVLNLLNALKIDQVHFCGVSLGGQIAQNLHARLPRPCRLAHLGQHDLRIHGCPV